MSKPYSELIKKRIDEYYHPSLWTRFVNLIIKIKNKFNFRTHENFRVPIPRHLKKNSKNWMDRDYIMAHYMFEIMCQFVEKEFMSEYKKWDGKHLYTAIVDDNYNPTGKWEILPIKETHGEWKDYSREHEYTLMKLYDWWTKDYPELMKTEWYDMFICDNQDPQIVLEEKEMSEIGCYTWEDIDVNEKLLTLLEIRQSLWT